MSRLIDADNAVETLSKMLWFDADGYVETESAEMLKRRFDYVPTVDAIPTEWIRAQMCEYPGMESAMWSKLLRIWKREAET